MTNSNANKDTSLYDYQKKDIERLFQQLRQASPPVRILYQLPTGGGKTVIFSEISRRFMENSSKKVLILTHRKELCRQTASTLKKSGIKSKVIDSSMKQNLMKENYPCYVAMVETLKNRIKDKLFNTDDIGLLIVDEAHHNSFRKLISKFPDVSLVGVTATPLSSDINLPLKASYDQLVIGESIASLISNGFLAKPKLWQYDVELNTLQTGINGDFTVRTSDDLYASDAMLKLLLHAYESHAKRKKTLIFNNGIFTSRKVLQLFEDAGYPVKHLDNKTSGIERAEILKWFRKTKGAILTSISILTTGFDEPSVQCVILNRATTSLTLYHQMIGRGARVLFNKKAFSVIDLGNNTERFGNWDAPLDWSYIFENPQAYYDSIGATANGESHHIPSDFRSLFPKSLELAFDVQKAYQDAVVQNQKPKIVMRDSIRQHARMCAENSDSVIAAIQLAEQLDKEINWRVKQYTICQGNVTKNYREWLQDDYKSKLKILIAKIMQRNIQFQDAV
ncbi:DEAD/DEAH box helicase [Taibaiella lutea]|uniref:DEAD/DEAH box helicase n=1 Tax=Taibaiella lutea TaxID=2608001 RepID=A0A5M6CJD6_9BACT|nr:DEAD/DEAH box helicase [Taibaiella lutea]KAA5535133.1 DEAD/DEAH box helicase [Taibaiella lutea]